MMSVSKKVFNINIAILILLFMCNKNLYAQGAPVTGDAQVDVGGMHTGEANIPVIIPVNINLTGVTAMDASSATVPAVLGNYRIAISYDNTLVKARTVGDVVTGGTTPDFSTQAGAHIITSGNNDTLVIMHTQLSDVSPVGSVNVAQVEFDILSTSPATVSLTVTILDLRTPLILTGVAALPVIGGENISSIVASGSINILAATDTDGDGMPDVWETANGFNPDNPDDGVLDNDFDGLNNAAEYLNSTDPHNPDSDNDLVPDGVEVAAGNNPNDDSDFPLWIISAPNIKALELRPYQYMAIANVTSSVFSLDSAPVGMTIDPATGVIDWIPVLGQTGDFNVVVRVNNNTDVATQNYVVNVIDIGDVNADGAVNAADLLLVQRHVLGTSVLDSQQVSRADMYPAGGDSQVTVSDLILLTRKILGL